jgi:hypothetical protein
MTGDIGAAIGAASFWMFIAAIVVAGIAGKSFRHHETQKTIRQAIERGQTLDPQTLDRLMEATSQKGPPPRAGFLVGGMIMLAIGAGLGAIGWAEATSHANASQLYQGLAVGALVGLIGVALIVAGIVVGKPGNGQP